MLRTKFDKILFLLKNGKSLLFPDLAPRCKDDTSVTSDYEVVVCQGTDGATRLCEFEKKCFVELRL